MAPITIGGHKAYGVFIMPGMGFRNNDATGLAINDEPEGIYYVVDGTHFDSGCCFDYGNASTNGRAVGTGTMETTYFGTATAWGSGAGPGPWIMADMEAGLFSGYNAKQNAADPTIDSWRFVTAVVDGGGGNQWDLRGGNAQQGGLTTFYSGVRPGSPASNSYYPMHKPGAVLLGIGGDNGNGSSGTFYEGVMTTGYPTEATTDAVQANIVAARYDVQRVSLSRVTTFTPGSAQTVTATFTNTTGAPASGVTLSLSLPAGWTAVVSGTRKPSMTFGPPVPPGASVNATFQVTSPAATGAGFLIGRAEWTGPSTSGTQSETTTARIRNVLPIKINEVRFSAGANATDQFIELYNASAGAVDLSNWTLINTQSQWAPRQAGDDSGRHEARERRLLPARPVHVGAGGARGRGRDHHQRQEHRRLRKRPADRRRRRDAHDRQRRDGGRGHDDGVHSCVHGTVDHDPCRIDQPACDEHDRLRGRREGGHRHRRQLRAGDGDRRRQGGHADDPVGGGGRGRDQHQGRGRREHDGRRHADDGHRRTQGTRQGRERRRPRRERHGRRPGCPAQVRSRIGR